MKDHLGFRSSTENLGFGLQVGNAVTDGRQIVVGMGSSQVLDAAFFAFANVSRGSEGDICSLLPSSA